MAIQGGPAQHSVSRAVIAIVSVALVVPPSVHGATTIGQTFAPNQACSVGETRFQAVSPAPPAAQYAVPAPGILTSWSFHAPNPTPQIKFKVLRPAGSGLFTIVGESEVKTPAASSLNTYTDVRVPVLAGDLIGLYSVTIGNCLRVTSGYTYAEIFGDPAVGTTTSPNGAVNNLQLDVSATIEPDCDSDGFGDETQDPSVDGCSPPPPDTTAPDTTITKRPKDKTKKKTATFEFTSTEPGSSFECKLDAGPFAPCTSPDTLKVKKGKHTLAVRARDAAGNVDGSPASDDWKVKKKKK
ncbi:MAG TPA: hypothetical protein VEK39_02780 [Solirubrobacterales bacterium]|nr:hypothetical protein [Solirubrobacterales bacterium]